MGDTDRKRDRHLGVQLLVRMSPELRGRLERLAEREERSVAGQVRLAIRRMCDEAGV